MGQAPPKPNPYGFPRLPIVVCGKIDPGEEGIIHSEPIPYPYYILWFNIEAHKEGNPVTFRVLAAGAETYADLLMSPHTIFRHCNETGIETNLDIIAQPCFIGPFPPNTTIALGVDNSEIDPYNLMFQVTIQPAPEVTR